MTGGGHVVTRTLKEQVWYPDHDARKASAEYTHVHHHLVVELDEACWICGIRRSTGGRMETHHDELEWALANGVNLNLVLKDFPAMGAADEPHLREWLDSEGNMLVLCDVHHRGGLQGVHMVTGPAWKAQRWETSHDITHD